MVATEIFLVDMQRGETMRRYVAEDLAALLGLLNQPSMEEDLDFLRVERVTRTPVAVLQEG